jgi:hypothetical protein
VTEKTESDFRPYTILVTSRKQAALLEAAPELLAALEALRLDDWTTYEDRVDAHGYASVDALEFARAALKKAEGDR